MPARQFPASSLQVAYSTRMSRPASQRPSWTTLANRFFVDATAREVRQAVTEWAAEGGLPDPCNRSRSTRRRSSSPTPGALTFGVEIEFRRPAVGQYGSVLDPEQIAQALRDAGISAFVENYNHTTRGHWKLIHDASSDRELVSPILSGEDGLRQVRTVMRVLRGLGCTVGSSEGMHVHIGAGHLDSEGVLRVVDGYFRNGARFDSVVARGRRGNGHGSHYCQALNSAIVQRVRRSVDSGIAPRNLSLGGRYYTVNLLALQQHGTIEFRQHQGTLNGTKAVAWVRLLLGFFEAAQAGDVPTFGTMAEMVQAFGLPAQPAAFLARRANDAMAVAS